MLLCNPLVMFVWLPVLLEQGGGADIHLHERGLAGAETIRAICARVEAGNMRGMVTISHAFVLGEDGEVDEVSTGCTVVVNYRSASAHCVSKNWS